MLNDDYITTKHLKQVSRIKHIILQKYLPSWERILGSKNKKLCYFDCYAGPGIYEYQKQFVDGSPIIAVKAATNYLKSSVGRNKQIILILVEKNDVQRTSLEKQLEKVQPYCKGLEVYVLEEDAKEFVPKILEHVSELAPSFFMVDPYGHPLTVPILNNILQHKKTEALITFMFYRINMDAGNSKVKHHLDEMFGNDEWRRQPFLKERVIKREYGFLNYFMSQLRVQYKLPFRIQFDIEDGLTTKNRTKYYLIHASNHPKAVLLMKEVMWPLGDEEGLFDYSGEKHGILISFSPKEEELRKILLRNYSGKEIEFDRLREETWDIPFIEKHYRRVIKQLKIEGLAKIAPITSKTDRGISGRDLVRFFNTKTMEVDK